MKKVIMLIVFFGLLFMSCFKEPVCKKYSRVISIDSIVYRGGYVTLENGMKVNVGQPYQPVTIGCKICVEWEK